MAGFCYDVVNPSSFNFFICISIPSAVLITTMLPFPQLLKLSRKFLVCWVGMAWVVVVGLHSARLLPNTGKKVPDL